MPRPPCCRLVSHLPPHVLFHPVGPCVSTLEVIGLGLDEYEALRLSDVEHLHRDQAAAHMAVSRQTFGRILDTAREKVATALVGGHALRIEGGPACPPPQAGWRCARLYPEGPPESGACPRLRAHAPGSRPSLPPESQFSPSEKTHLQE